MHLKLRSVTSPVDPSKTLYVIAEHEDFYHPDDFAALLVPPLIPLIRFVLLFATWMCVLNTMLFQRLGFWVARDGEGGKGVSVQPEGEPLPPVEPGEAFELQDRSASKSKKDD